MPVSSLSRYFESSVGGVKGIDTKLHHKALFYARQFLNALSPTNFAMTNPSVLEKPVKTRNDNLISGLTSYGGLDLWLTNGT